MVHLEMSYLTHSKFSTTMILDILPLFRVRFRIFDELCNSNSLPPEIRGNWELWYSFLLSNEVWNSLWINTLTLFRTRFRVLDDLVTFSSVRDFGVIFPLFFRMKFGNDFVPLLPEVWNGSYKMILLSPSTRGFWLSFEKR